MAIRWRRYHSQCKGKRNEGDKENTKLAKKRAVKVLVQYLGGYRLDKITPFVIEKFPCITTAIRLSGK